MKKFNRTNLPEQIKYNNAIYKPDYNGSDVKQRIKQYNTENKKFVIVNVLSKNLKGKTDLRGNNYKPTVWIFLKEQIEKTNQLELISTTIINYKWWESGNEGVNKEHFSNLKEIANNHIKNMTLKGFTSGELPIQKYASFNAIYTGFWELKKEQVQVIIK